MHDDEYEREGFSPLGNDEGSGTAATGTSSATSDSAWIRASRCLWVDNMRRFHFLDIWGLQIWGCEDSDAYDDEML